MTLLLTGAAGGVATMIRPLLLQRYGKVRLSDRTEVDDLQEGESAYFELMQNLADALVTCLKPTS